MAITAILYIELFTLNVILVELHGCFRMVRLFFINAARYDKHQKKNGGVNDPLSYLGSVIFNVISVHLPLLVVEYLQANG